MLRFAYNKWFINLNFAVKLDLKSDKTMRCFPSDNFLFNSKTCRHPVLPGF